MDDLLRQRRGSVLEMTLTALHRTKKCGQGRFAMLDPFLFEGALQCKLFVFLNPLLFGKVLGGLTGGLSSFASPSC